MMDADRLADATSLLLDTVDLKLACDGWKCYANALSKLCACYRLQKRPSETLLSDIEAAKKFLLELGETL